MEAQEAQGMPKLEVAVSVLVEEHQKLFPRKFFDPNLTDQKPGRVKRWTVCPDTGAHVFMSGVALMHRLNLSSRTLIHMSQSVIAANEADIGIIGGVILRVSVRAEGIEISTNILCYISRECKGMYLSLAACKTSQKFTKTFPLHLGNWLQL